MKPFALNCPFLYCLLWIITFLLAYFSAGQRDLFWMRDF